MDPPVPRRCVAEPGATRVSPAVDPPTPEVGRVGRVEHPWAGTSRCHLAMMVVSSVTPP